MKLKKLLKVLPPFQYIKITRIENNSITTGKVFYAKNFPKDSTDLDCKIKSVVSRNGKVEDSIARYITDYLEIYIEIGGNKID